ncbi:NosD domain-containing protein [Rhizobium sp. Root482]|uniref:NosD domain-containing protein n=1 Tax=Rhizobium sp. Root482 TaxID=1736543 RepID=UPI0006F8101B|nr:right-handed parallel beta-helix repeat-containing protein [Rhizobium sp. Root482]KQY13273.1 hypothetical protein ASD31_13940 [Rhizobium sp. Root482]
MPAFPPWPVACLLLTVLSLYLGNADQAAASPDQCSPRILAALRAPATKQAASIEIRCSLTLAPTDVVTKRIFFSGARASGAVIDCQGATLDGSPGTINSGKSSLVLIRSTKTRTGDWSVPTDITLRNCIVKGAIRLQGLGTNGQAKAVKQSSYNRDHTGHAQASAPTRITLSGLTLIADGRIPLYLGPGVTGVTLRRSTIAGHSNGTALYLDAESARNTIIDNRFSVTTKSREQIAVDGSAYNVISGNRFDDPVGGGIFLYRNCGEGGTIRHQAPQHNVISGNVFRYRASFFSQPAVWLNSRNGARFYCFRDPDYPFGSSASSLDFAKFNTVTGNRLIGGGPSLIRNDDDTNTVDDNGE